MNSSLTGKSSSGSRRKDRIPFAIGSGRFSSKILFHFGSASDCADRALGASLRAGGADWPITGLWLPDDPMKCTVGGTLSDKAVPVFCFENRSVRKSSNR